MNQHSKEIRISRFAKGDLQVDSDLVAVEEPLEIRLDFDDGAVRRSHSISITMRTPGNDLELALGFLCGESIVHCREDVAEVDYCGKANSAASGNAVRVELKPGVMVDLDRLQRHFYTSSSCGVCGKASLEALEVLGQGPLESVSTTFSADLLTSLPQLLRARQKVFGETGGLHAAAVFSPAGEIRHLREDVGRHNAVDKVVGKLLNDGELPAHGYGLLVSGRASFELMQKALVAGLPLLAAIGAPSSLAVELAERYGMTLIGFLKAEKFNIYAGAHRIST
jgi:FdhD protein